MRAKHLHRTRTLQRYRRLVRPGERVYIRERGRWAWFVGPAGTLCMCIGQYRLLSPEGTITFGAPEAEAQRQDVSPVALRVVLLKREDFIVPLEIG